jgi:chlorobactene glucosyltransferase
MIYQIVIASLIFLFMVNLMINLRHLRIPDKNAKVPNPAPLISVLIPARNEGKNIRACVESLQKQDYPNYEILVLDDNSTDQTAIIVKDLAATDKRIQLHFGESLPENWGGKSFACYQLAQKAKGDWILFVDADTVHKPFMLRSIFALANEMNTSLLSGFPQQTANNLAVKIIIPVFYFIILGWVPLWLLHRARKPKPSVAIGQFFFFNKNEYWRIGGHKAVQSKIVEDIWMGIEVGRHGGRHIAVDLSPVTSCQMYVDFGDVWRGLGRSIQSVVATSPLGIIALIGIVIATYILPFYWLLNGFFIGAEPLLWRGIVVLQIVMTLFMRWLVDNHFRMPAISVVFHPFGITFYLVNVIYCGIKNLLGIGISWKARSYTKESMVE